MPRLLKAQPWVCCSCPQWPRDGGEACGVSGNREIVTQSLVLVSVFCLLQALCWSSQRHQFFPHAVSVCHFQSFFPGHLSGHAQSRKCVGSYDRHAECQLRSEGAQNPYGCQSITWPRALWDLWRRGDAPNLWKAYGEFQNSLGDMVRGVDHRGSCLTPRSPGCRLANSFLVSVSLG